MSREAAWRLRRPGGTQKREAPRQLSQKEKERKGKRIGKGEGNGIERTGEKMAPVSYGFDQLLRLRFSFSHTHTHILSFSLSVSFTVPSLKRSRKRKNGFRDFSAVCHVTRPRNTVSG